MSNLTNAPGESVANFKKDANSANAWRGAGQALCIDAVKGEDSSVVKVTLSSQVRVLSTIRTQSSEDMEDYVPQWARSSKPNEHDRDDSGDDQDSSSGDQKFSPADELPPFADEASKALHREIKLLEQRRDEAVSSTRSHKERIGIINDHLRSIHQEIDHTTSLVDAKKSEVGTEEHLLLVSQREIGQSLRFTSVLENANVTAQKNITSISDKMKTAEDDLEKIRTDLNWNQEELEQWATAATKKEEESLTLQKYTLADELKIKDLTLTIEDLTKVSVEKKTLLENEVTETKSHQTELETLAERFKSRHGERRQLIQQWKDTIESMNNRDQTINNLARKYSSFAQREDESKKSLHSNREQYAFLEVRYSLLTCLVLPRVLLLSTHIDMVSLNRMREMILNKMLITKNGCCKLSAKSCLQFKIRSTHLKTRSSRFSVKTQWLPQQLKLNGENRKWLRMD